jgi:hypothetical protein
MGDNFIRTSQILKSGYNSKIMGLLLGYMALRQ